MAKKKVRRAVAKGVVHVKATFNNTIITITDPTGNVLCQDSAGTIGFKGSRKSTPFAAQRAAEACADKAIKMGMHEVEVRIKGPGSGRESAVTALQAAVSDAVPQYRRNRAPLTPLPPESRSDWRAAFCPSRR